MGHGWSIDALFGTRRPGELRVRRCGGVRLARTGSGSGSIVAQNVFCQLQQPTVVLAVVVDVRREELLLGTGDGRVVVFRTCDAEIVAEYSLSPTYGTDHHSSIFCIAVPDRRHVLLATTGDEQIRVFAHHAAGSNTDALTQRQRCLRIERVASPIMNMVLTSADLLCVALRSGGILVLDDDARAQIAEFAPLGGSAVITMTICGGGHILGGDVDGNLRIWPKISRQPRPADETQRAVAAVSACLLSPRESRPSVASSTREARDRSPVIGVVELASAVKDPRDSRSRTCMVILSVHRDGLLRVWDVLERDARAGEGGAFDATLRTKRRIAAKTDTARFTSARLVGDAQSPRGAVLFLISHGGSKKTTAGVITYNVFVKDLARGASSFDETRMRFAVSIASRCVHTTGSGLSAASLGVASPYLFIGVTSGIVQSLRLPRLRHLQDGGGGGGGGPVSVSGISNTINVCRHQMTEISGSITEQTIVAHLDHIVFDGEAPPTRPSSPARPPSTSLTREPSPRRISSGSPHTPNDSAAARRYSHISPSSSRTPTRLVSSELIQMAGVETRRPPAARQSIRPSAPALVDLQTASEEPSPLDAVDRVVPDAFVCPITLCAMEDPVILIGDGISYERSAIERWLSSSSNVTSPATNVVLIDRTLVPNVSLKKAIAEWKEF